MKQRPPKADARNKQCTQYAYASGALVLAINTFYELLLTKSFKQSPTTPTSIRPCTNYSERSSVTPMSRPTL